MAPASSGPSRPLPILLIEDNPGDARLVRETLSDPAQADAVHVVSTADAALDFLSRRGDYDEAPRPRLILLDWHLPDIDGGVFLSRLKTDPDLDPIPTIVFTGTQSEQEVREAYANHANAWITKASDPEELTRTIRALEEFWLSVARLPSSDDD